MSTLLAEQIRKSIEANGGKITFADYMQQVLYTPGIGYYCKSDTPIGKHGDFITAPEISPIFAYCLANQLQSIMQHLGSSSILEFGAGNGSLVAELLKTLQQREQLPEHYYIIELSASLQLQQRETVASQCPELLSRVIWLEHLPEKFNGIVIANEVIDAMPVHCFSYQQQTIYERYVALDSDQFVWQLGAVSSPPLLHAIEKILAEVGPLPQPYTSEINFFIGPWLVSIESILQSGVIFLIDYGFSRREYYHHDRHMGTLMCHQQHQASTDPFIRPGEHDLTAHVDFTAVAEAAVSASLNLAGYTTQAYFLLSCGITNYQTDSELERQQLNHAIKKLTLPHEMGELIKVIAFTKNYPAPLMGFNWRDLSQRL